MSGAVDQEMFETAIRDNLSPEASRRRSSPFFSPQPCTRPPTENARRGLRELEWLANTLIDLLGVDEYNRLLDELGL